MRPSLALGLLVTLSGCGAAPPAEMTPDESEAAVTEEAPDACAGAGAWSSAVDGLRGRLVVSGAGASLRVVIELENVSAQPIALHWDGSPSVGFATFALRDAAGNEPMPDWVFGGSEPTGALALVIPAGSAVERDATASFVAGPGGEARVLRIGAFWGRPMPEDGSPRYLSARVVARAPAPGDVTEEGDAVSGARAWVGAIELPAACID